MERPARIKVAVVGGGPAGLCAAYELVTREPDRYDVTVYQMGWRVGGKGASGYRRWQPPGAAAPVWNRIEEHGLHILFGFYDSVFNVLRRVYEELEREPEGDFRQFDQAFEPRDLGSIMHRRLSRWNVWNMSMPRNTRKIGEAPGGRIESATPGDVLRTLIRGSCSMVKELLSLPYGDQPTPSPDSISTRLYESVGGLLAHGCRATYDQMLKHPRGSQGALRVMQAILHAVNGVIEVTTTSFLLWHALDYALAALRGSITFQLRNDSDFEHPELEAQDYRAFLRAHGLHRRSVYGPFVDVIYHAAFSYQQGDTARPAVAAGTALRLNLQAGFFYKGAAYYKMRGGMGDTVFAPLYRVLRKRGVKFAFFHRVTAYRLDPETRTQIAEIEIDVQAKVRNGQAYEPLITTSGAKPCLAFPSTPLTDQLDHAGNLAGTESYYDSTIAERKTLKRGTDFDFVIGATPVETLRHIARDLIAARPDTWVPMVDRVTAVQTASAQLYFDQALPMLGWTAPRRCARADTLLSLYRKPISTFCPMDQTLERETWGNESPQCVVYLTGVHPGPPVAPTGAEGITFDAGEQREARHLIRDFAKYFIAEDLLPKLEDPELPGSPDWNRLFDPEGRIGPERLRAQYFRSNNDPSARCTLAEPGATKFRLAADESGFSNLVLAGDWIRNGVNCACMEGAFRSGMQAAAAVRRLAQ